MDKSESIKDLAMALNKAQSEMGGAVKDSNNPFFKSKYADLAAVVKAIKEPFANNGLSYTQFPIENDGRIGVETILMHESGEFLSQSFTVPMSKQDAQAAGSCITYCRRYALQSIAGIPAEDDDGNAASQQASIHTNPQEEEFHGILGRDGALEMAAFSQTVGPDVMASLNESFKPGQKSSGKAKTKKLISEGWLQVDEIARQIKELLDANDPAVTEITDELTTMEKRMVITKLSDHEVNKLKKIKESI